MSQNINDFVTAPLSMYGTGTKNRPTWIWGMNDLGTFRELDYNIIKIIMLKEYKINRIRTWPNLKIFTHSP